MKAKYLSLLLAATIMVGAPTWAKEKQNKPKTEQAKNGKKKLFGRKKKNQPAPKDSAKVEKPSIERKGLFNVTKVKNEWFFEIPDSLIGREFLTTVRYTSTPAGIGKFGGEQVNQQTVYFQVAPDDQLLLRSRLFVNVADTTENINRAITISNENPIIGAFKVESHKNKLYKIKVNQFFNQDNPAIGLPKSVKDGFSLQGQVNEMSYIEDIKSFPLNTDGRMVKTFNGGGTNRMAATSRTGKATFGLNVSFGHWAQRGLGAGGRGAEDNLRIRAVCARVGIGGSRRR